MSVRIMKFGGAVLSGVEGFRNMLSILSEGAGKMVVVVSAFSTATRDLEFAARLAKKGLTDEATEVLSRLVEDHVVLIRQLLPDPSVRTGMETLLKDTQLAISDLLAGISITGQLTPRTMDEVLGYGEFLALHIARHVIVSSGIDAGWVDARQVIVTDDSYGSAMPLLEKSAVLVDKNLKPLIATHQLVLIQGFVGATESGHTTTMGRESSNLTATVVGSLIDASDITIWTDVEGIRSADPQMCADTRVRPHLSYTDATIAAHHGVKLLYPTMIEPAHRSSIPIYIRSAQKPYGEYTTISASALQCDPIVAVQQHSTNVSNVHTLFVRPKEWISICTSAVSASDSEDVMAIHADADVSLCTIQCTSESSASILTRLHQLITNTEAQ